MSSFSMLKTNVALTSNVKVMVNNKYNLYLESIDSDGELSKSRYKKFRFNKENKYDTIIPIFYKGLPSEIAFRVKNDMDSDVMYQDFKYQYDDLYQSGCSTIKNKLYKEEFECFAPLYFDTTLPSNFIIFRLDGSGIINMSSKNFKNEVLNKLKCVEVFDMSKKTDLGQWLNNSYSENIRFPKDSMYIDFRPDEFSYFTGIDYELGSYISKSLFLNDVLNIENTYSDLSKLLLDTYANNQILYPNIINLSFMFDDIPATRNSIKKWSINRYMGFYLDSLDKVKSVSVYNTNKLKSNVFIGYDNILYLKNIDGTDEYKNIKIYEKELIDDNNKFIDIDGLFYEIREIREIDFSKEIDIKKVDVNTFEEVNVVDYLTKYKIISDKDFSFIDMNRVNSSTIKIDTNNIITYENGNNIIDDDEFIQADVWLIEIDGKYHNLIKNENSNNIYINTDYGFNIDDNYFEYFIDYPNQEHLKRIDITSRVNPTSFNIYKCNFTDIKDFDTNIIETEHSNFEYNNSDTITDSMETKIYSTDYNSKSIPKLYEEYIYKNNIVNIPTSSEYMGSGELFSIDNNSLNILWSKNPRVLKWGFNNSLSNNDYPYLLNTNLTSEVFNRTTDISADIISNENRNLDYFYNLISPDNIKYDFQTLSIPHIEYSKGYDNYKFLNKNINYFKELFNSKTSNRKGEFSINKKYSIINKGDVNESNNTLFRGIKFNFNKIDNVKKNGNVIEKITISNTNKFDNYKFSILISSNDTIFNVDKNDKETVLGVEKYNTNLNWIRIKSFDDIIEPKKGDIIEYNGVLYKAIKDDYSKYVNSPYFVPDINTNRMYDSKYFEYYSDSKTILWNPSLTYAINEVIIHNNNYMVKTTNSSTNEILFWNPNVNYTLNSYCFYDEKFYKLTKIFSDFSENHTIPPYSNNWTLVQSKPNGFNFNWQIVKLWIEGSDNNFKFSYYEDSLYENINGDLNSSPSNSNAWVKRYNINPDSSLLYGNDSSLINKNNLIKMNNRYNLLDLKSNNQSYDYKLNSGGILLIDEVNMNITLNIFINDNTHPIKDLTDYRFNMYDNSYFRLSASNIINYLNNPDLNYGFSEPIRYVIKNNDGVKTYNIENIERLEYFINCETIIDYLFIKNNSLIVEPINIDKNILKVNSTLKNNNIESLSDLNKYNDNIPIATKIVYDRSEKYPIPNFHSLKNELYFILCRYSGNYTPIFYDINLFSDVNNYKFDSSLKDFGMTKERVISKINRDVDILKLKDKVGYKSIYAMVDECGYSIIKSFIFKSNWDSEYYVEFLNKK